MTDERLRALERAFQQSGSPEDELAYLQARVRTGAQLDWDSYQRLAELSVEAASEYLLARVERGELEREKLELAAYCSHEPARVALGESAPEVPEDLEVWLRGFAKWPAIVPMQSLATVARHYQESLEGNDEAEGHRVALEAVTAWMACPCTECARSVWAAMRLTSPTLPAWCAGKAVERTSERAADLLVKASRHVNPQEQLRPVVSQSLVRWALALG